MRTSTLATLNFIPQRLFAKSIGLLSRLNYSPFTKLSSKTHIHIFNCFLPCLPCLIIQHEPTRSDPGRESGRLSCFRRIPLTISQKSSTTDWVTWHASSFITFPSNTCEIQFKMNPKRGSENYKVTLFVPYAQLDWMRVQAKNDARIYRKRPCIQNTACQSARRF